MSILRIKELEQQLKRRDERLAYIEAKIKALERFEPEQYLGGMTSDTDGQWLYLDDVLECFK